MKGEKVCKLLIGTREDVSYQATLADLRTFMQQAEIMSDSDWPQMFISVAMEPTKTYLVATYEVY